MKIRFITLVFLLALMACQDEIDPRQISDLVENDFLFFPNNPRISDLVFMITYDCEYNDLASVNVSNKNILVKKRFNSMMKWPCLLSYDTINLGQLSQGTYDVTLQIIDINPTVTDSVFSEVKQQVKISD